MLLPSRSPCQYPRTCLRAKRSCNVPALVLGVLGGDIDEAGVLRVLDGREDERRVGGRVLRLVDRDGCRCTKDAEKVGRRGGRVNLRKGGVTASSSMGEMTAAKGGRTAVESESAHCSANAYALRPWLCYSEGSGSQCRVAFGRGGKNVMGRTYTQSRPSRRRRWCTSSAARGCWTC